MSLTEFKRREGCYEVFVGAVKIGEVYSEVDGYYVFDGSTCLSDPDVMDEITAEVNRLNAPWDAQVQAYCAQLPPGEKLEVELELFATDCNSQETEPHE